MILLARCGEHEFYGEPDTRGRMRVEVRRGLEDSRERVDSWTLRSSEAREAIVAWCKGRLGATAELLWSHGDERAAPRVPSREYEPLRLDDQDINGVLTRVLFKRQPTPRHPAADLLGEGEEGS